MSISVEDLFNALEQFGERYVAINAFADDIQEFREALTQNWKLPGSWIPASGKGQSLLVPIRDRCHYVRLFPGEGVVQLSRPVESVANDRPSKAMEELVRTTVQAATVAKGASWPSDLQVAVLIGSSVATIEGSDSFALQVFVLQLDSASAEWRPYDGGLLRWVKRQLGIAAPRTSLP